VILSSIAMNVRGNDKRSHAGSGAFDCKRDDLPALAGATGSLSRPSSVSPERKELREANLAAQNSPQTRKIINGVLAQEKADDPKRSGSPPGRAESVCPKMFSVG